MQEKVEILNSNNQKIAGVIHIPKEKAKKLAILCPGFLDTKDYYHLVELGKMLANNGYTVVRFDPTGIWESEGDISDYNMTQYLKDIQSVKNYMLENENYNSILLAGHSRGGRVSLLYATIDSDISVVIGIMPSAKSIPRNLDKQRKNNEWKEKGERISSRDIPNNEKERKKFVVPYSFLEDSLKYNVLNEIYKIHIPILLISGELDTTIYPKEVKEIFDKANEPKKFVIIPGIDHDYRHNLNEINKVNDVIEKFIRSIQLA